MKAFLKHILTDARDAHFIMALIGFTSLAGALISQYIFGLLPCVLCIYQRWPHGVVILLGLIGASVSKHAVKFSAFLMFLSGVAMFIGSGIAFFHTGVELKWWQGTDSCGIPLNTNDFDAFKNQILNAPAVRCDEIPWADPILGLSMANYNVILSLLTGVYGVLTSIGIARKANNML